jgi:hypothetical protein
MSSLHRRPLKLSAGPRFSECRAPSRYGLVAMLQTSPECCRLPSLETGTEGSNPLPSATESRSLAIPRLNHRKARYSRLIWKGVVAEKITFNALVGNSRQKSLLANSERPFGPRVERS